MSTLTPVQNQIIALLAAGHSVTDAAAQLDLHRTTIHQWKRTNPEFANALADAKEDAADHYRSQCHQHAELALSALVALLNDPKASPSVRLKAALHILNGASGQAPKAARPRPAIQQNSSLFITPEPEKPAPPADSSLFNTSTQITTVVRTGPKIGRNEQCPCGSNKKYKQCCLGRKAMAA